MNGKSVLGQKVVQNLQIEIKLKSATQNLKITFVIPVGPTRSNIPLKLHSLQVYSLQVFVQCLKY